MNSFKTVKYTFVFLIGAALIGVALFYIRHLSFSFPLGTTTSDHPYIAFTATLMIANLIWAGLIYVVKKWVRSEPPSDRALPLGNTHATSPLSAQSAQWRPQLWKPRLRLWLWGLLGFSLALRAMFLGSVPIYEDDWNRYLWDGASIVQGVNPYKYSPDEILAQVADEQIIEEQKRISPEESEKLLALSDDGYAILNRINNSRLTTIYPPSAQVGFAVAAFIKPLDIDGLRLVFLAIEVLTLFLMIKALSLYGRSPLWVLIYAFNPLLIYSAFNVVHMDIMLPPFIMAALILVKRNPLWAALAIAGAAAVKVWPLILAPIFYRNWTHRPRIYIAAAALVSVTSLILFWPMLTQIRPDSGLSAYSQNWQRSSFLFPAILTMIESRFENAGQSLRLAVAAVLTAMSLILGFGHMLKRAQSRNLAPKNNAAGPRHFPDTDTIPRALMVLTLALLFLSPTGYPWYVIWVIMFIPFVPFYGAAMLCVLVPLYYVRFALGEQGRYEVYQAWLVPLQFGIPILILLFEYCVAQLRKPTDAHPSLSR